MLTSYLKTAIRNLKKNTSYAIINTLGLAIGIAACLLIFLVVKFEVSFDTFHPNKENIYRIGSAFKGADGVSYSGGASFPVANGIRLDFPQIEKVASIYAAGAYVSVEEPGGGRKLFREEGFFYVEPEFFDIFQFGWLSGSAETSLKDPHSAVLTQATAEKYFGNWKAALGKTFRYKNEKVFTVTGILKNMPSNTDFPLSTVVSYSALQQTPLKENLDDWISTFGSAYTFVVLPPELPVSRFNAALLDFSKKHKKAAYSTDYYIAQPLAEMHFDDRFGNYNRRTFSHSLVKALSLIGIFLIVIACVNFVNLATAQAANRAREVGVRKVLGSSRKQLALQFLGETALIVICATVLAVMIAFAALPFLNRLLEEQLVFHILQDPALAIFLVSTIIFVTFLAGFYPAMVLSAFKPLTALRNRVFSGRKGGLTLRRTLVVFQFAIAHLLIIGMIVVVNQMSFFRDASLGFRQASIVTVPVKDDSISLASGEFLRNQLLANPDIESVSFSFGSPADNSNWNSDFKFDHSEKTTNFSANLKWADPEYFNTYDLQFLAGSSYPASDTVRGFVVNEKLLEKVGIREPQQAIGKQLNFWDGEKVGEIVGVVRDFNSQSLREPVSPVVLGAWKATYRTINIKMKPGTEKSSLAYIESIWTKVFPDNVYDYEFLDDKIRGFYKQEAQLSQLYKIFAAIAIFISCLGLYGLVSFMAVQRTKEMGIRKVLGATAGNIVYLLSREFTLLVILSFIIAAPVAYKIMHEWLQNYTYRIEPGVSVFLTAIAGSMLIAWLTVAYRAITAAVANPVKSLRAE